MLHSSLHALDYSVIYYCAIQYFSLNHIVLRPVTVFLPYTLYSELYVAIFYVGRIRVNENKTKGCEKLRHDTKILDFVSKQARVTMRMP